MRGIDQETPILILLLEGAKFNPRVCSMNHKERGPGKALPTRPTGEGPARRGRGQALLAQMWMKPEAALVQAGSATGPA